MRRMERWEHMTVTVEQAAYGVQMTTIEGPMYEAKLSPLDQSLGGDPVLRQLDELGGKGWQLINVEPQAGKRVYWLKRPIAEGASRNW